MTSKREAPFLIYLEAVDRPKFIADENVGKLGRYLRRLGFDTAIFQGGEDRDMVRRAEAEGRVILTRDTHIRLYGIATSGRVTVLTFATDDAGEQLRQVVAEMELCPLLLPYTRCLECNEELEKRSSEDMAGRVPPYVFATQKQYMECPGCGRIYWRGTHWKAMEKEVEKWCG
jgi:uncharacterized protein with PIN domain